MCVEMNNFKIYLLKKKNVQILFVLCIIYKKKIPIGTWTWLKNTHEIKWTVYDFI